jgi:hypothetical protein
MVICLVYLIVSNQQLQARSVIHNVYAQEWWVLPICISMPRNTPLLMIRSQQVPLW